MPRRSLRTLRKEKFSSALCTLWLIRSMHMITEWREVKMDTSKANEADPLLAIQDLHVWYELRRLGFGHAGYVKAVDGVTFRLEEGETIAVVGESGCGKSSLMKTILGPVSYTHLRAHETP